MAQATASDAGSQGAIAGFKQAQGFESFSLGRKLQVVVSSMVDRSGVGDAQKRDLGFQNRVKMV